MEQNGDPISQEYRGSIFVGSSTADDEGGPTFEQAVNDAYEKAKGQGKHPPFRVREIWVDGNNPLSEYRVAIG
jgi:hypothetical protein